MNVDKFWQREHDIHTIHHTHFKHSLLTDEELRNTATDFLADIWVLSGEWYEPEDSHKTDSKK